MFGPGLALLVALGVRQRVLLLGAAPAASVGVAILTASGAALLGVRYGPWTLVVGSVLLAGAGIGLGRGLRRFLGPPAALPPPAAKPLLPRLSGMPALLAQLAGLVFLFTGAGLALRSWIDGFGGWDDGLGTYNQDHDPILHAVLTTFIQRSGRGAPWEIMPADVVVGTPTVYYPDGFHLIAATIGAVFGDPVVGMNAAAAMIIGAAWCTSAAALAALAVRWLRDDAGWMTLAGGVASLVAAGLYRPGVQLARDNGLLPNAAALVLVPGVVAAILLIRPRAWATAVGIGVACAGIVAVHPSSGLSVGLTVLLFWIALLFARDGRAMLRAQWSVLVLTVVVAAAAGAPVLRGALAVSERIGAFPPDTANMPLTRSLGQVVPLMYGGMFDDKALVQTWPTVLLIAGLITALVMRRAVPLVVAWVVWVVIVLLAYRNPTGITEPILGFFYNSAGRVRSHTALFAPALAALGTFGLLSALLAAVGGIRLPPWMGDWQAAWRRRWFDDQGALAGPGTRAAPYRIGSMSVSTGSGDGANPKAGRWEPLARLRPRLVAAFGVFALVAFGYGYVAGPSVGYLATTSEALSQRWSHPQLYRVDAADVAAAEWLKARVKPGQRIMNNPNDGSTFLYVAHGLPIVEVSTLGVPNFPYTYKLMKGFRYLDIDPDIRRLVLDLNIAWVYVDPRAPIIGADGAPDDWTGGGLMTTVPGLDGLDDTPGLILAHVSGPVHIYKVDLDEIRHLDDNA
ncbi:DUF6541 family protein [Pseudonocardia acaciae]|uniref:DUF6541 family protein n=1 Tax=Pseudonocardia acaciae TaxID=551276 RepID=UPI00048D5561|nr:DUF6541 family protein [Pseudonocardia acaciae]